MEFSGRLAVVTGGGSGMGRELVVQLASEGCSVATCDVNTDALAETALLAEKGAPVDTRVTTHVCDVSDEAQVVHFRDEVIAHHYTTFVNFLFNNAGIGGGGSFVDGKREAWEKTFAVCWGGVYNCSRAFVPLLVASEEGYLVNTSSANGFWASIGPGMPHTAYSTAKFAVKGFSEALIEDFRVHAPHVKVAVVMPGHIGTDIVANSRRLHGEARIEDIRSDFAKRGMPTDGMSDDEVRAMIDQFAETFRDSAPLSAADAATLILDGVRNDRWRILVGEDAIALDAAVRADPENAYSGMSLGALTDRA